MILALVELDVLEVQRRVVRPLLRRRDPVGELARLVHRVHARLHVVAILLARQPLVVAMGPGGLVDQLARGREPVAAVDALVPVEALSTIFRAKFMKMSRKALPHETFPEAIWQKQWVVYCKPTVQGAEKVLEYLSRYVYRIAITNNRIVSACDGRVSFRYKESRKRKCRAYWRTMTLPAVEFLRRFLQHVLPKGFHKVRYYGLLNPATSSIAGFIT